MTVRRHRRYSTEFKIQLVQAYLDGEGSARSIATRHEVPHSLPSPATVPKRSETQSLRRSRLCRSNSASL